MNNLRRYFVKIRIESLSNDEIAAKLNISKRTVENKITIALKHLRFSYPEFAAILLAISISIQTNLF